MDPREYSPRRATLTAAAASIGTLLSLAVVAAWGGDSSGRGTGSAADTVPAAAAPTPSTSASATPAPSTLATQAPAAPATSTTATSTTAACTDTHTVVAGDSWLLIAGEASVGADELFALNGATADTPLFAGDAVCLPDGATVVTVPALVRRATPATTSPTRGATAAPVATVAAPAQTTRASG